MKTDELVEMLARGAEPVPRHATRNRLLAVVALGMPLTVVLVAVSFGIRHDLGRALGEPLLWIKFGVPLAVAIAAGLSLRRLTRPGVPAGPASVSYTHLTLPPQQAALLLGGRAS